MPLAAGDRLGAYDILGLIGAGGMGEVYRARDGRLQRDVAFKILPALFAADSERLARFQREAQILASLNHPNIAAIYGMEETGTIRALVLELVEGPTLADRIVQGPVPLDEALPIARQIAEALEAAHEHGIVHRDLKPANIKVRPDGTVKVLDFGLAKAFEGEPASVGGLSMAPTITSPAATRLGTILGTAAYMSPEQARGKAVDKRTDIWAFGCVLYEMLTGKRPFPGDEITDVLARVLEREPSLDALPPTTPPAVRRLLRRCLDKDPRARLPHIGAARLEIKDAEAGEELVAPVVPLPRRLAVVTVTGIGAIAVAVAVVATWWLVRPQDPSAAAVVRASIALPSTASVRAGRFAAANIAISPDGTHIVYAGAAGDGSQLYVRSLDRMDVAPIPGTEGALNPFFSPDGQWVAFFAGGQLKKVPIVGGGSLALCDAEFVFGGAWSEDGTIVFGGNLQGGLMRVSSDGGQAEPFTSLQKGEGSHRWPALIRGNRDVLFAVGSGTNWDDARIAVQSLDSTEHRVLPDLGTSPRYVPTGHVIFARAGSLFAAPFDPVRRATTGPATLLLADVSTTTLGGNAQYAVSAAGTLVYVPGGDEDVRRSLVWVDRNGMVETVPGAKRGFEIPRISPDGERAAVTIREGDADVWIVELRRGTLTRITSEAGEDHSVAWTPDGRQVTYSSTRDARSRVMAKAADGSGGEEHLFAVDEHTHLGGWTPDGRVLLTDAGAASTKGDLYAVNVGEKNPRRAYLQTLANEHDPQPSPDGRWIAYTSDESGRDEVYVQALPVSAARTQISSEGGSEPMWDRSGRELFYRSGDKMMAATVEASSTFRAGLPRVLFEGQYARILWGQSSYDVSPDGRRFLMITTEAQTPSTELRLIVNWFAELLGGSR